MGSTSEDGAPKRLKATKRLASTTMGKSAAIPRPDENNPARKEVPIATTATRI